MLEVRIGDTLGLYSRDGFGPYDMITVARVSKTRAIDNDGIAINLRTGIAIGGGDVLNTQRDDGRRYRVMSAEELAEVKELRAKEKILQVIRGRLGYSGKYSISQLHKVLALVESFE